MNFDNLLKIQEIQNKSTCVKARQISFKRAHNPKVVGSNPAPATNKIRHLRFSNHKCLFIFLTYF